MSSSILFTLELSDTLSEMQLRDVALGSVVEFGSDYQYLSVPAPGALSMLLVGSLAASRRRRR